MRSTDAAEWLHLSAQVGSGRGVSLILWLALLQSSDAAECRHPSSTPVLVADLEGWGGGWSTAYVSLQAADQRWSVGGVVSQYLHPLASMTWPGDPARWEGVDAQHTRPCMLLTDAVQWEGGPLHNVWRP